jgi:Fe2+ transport system protein FeoA
MIRSFTDSSVHVNTTSHEPVPVTRALTLEALAREYSSGHFDAAVIDRVEGTPPQRRRLLEAGFTAGCPVRFVMATPFGDPLVFSLRGASIALRKSEARCVRVRVAAAS